jgi:hydrogenase maturation protein HypF
MKGIGGFHLITLASGSDAVLRLRSRKNREEKPFAIMVPSLELAANCCDLDDLERLLLTSPEAPIVLVRKRTAGAQVHAVVENVAPRNPYLGIMLPYTPLHHLLMHDLGEAVVATSGNLSDEPICTDEREAMIRLKGIADVFLVHNRPIVRHVDDSIIRLIAGREMVMRRARGYAPLPVTLPLPVEKSYVAVGAHLKNTIAVNVGRDVFLSQHIGDLETPESMDAFRRVIEDLRKMYDIKSPSWICDLHPAYVSSIFARSQGSPSEIQHHHAHVASCMAENQLEGPLLGVSWDGTGFGPDSTVWGGEFFESTGATFNRIATFRCFGLPGGEMAIREPRRTALGALYEIFGTDILSMKNLKSVTAFSAAELKPLMKMLQNRIQTPRTSSVGRLFDAVASVIGVRHFVHYEGQAAMELEFLLENDETNEGYSYHVREEHQSQKNITFDSPLLIDWHPMLKELLVDLEAGIPLSRISKKFHNALSEIIIDIVNRTKNSKVVLTGGCFQNRYLLERSVRRLREEGFTPYWHQRIPPNDGGIALGQIYAQLMRESS